LVLVALIPVGASIKLPPCFWGHGPERKHPLPTWWSNTTIGYDAYVRRDTLLVTG
jgi:hypothetical protein